MPGKMSTTPRVLVTGAHGFVGRPTVEELLRFGFEVHTVGRAISLNEISGVIEHQADLLQPEGPARLIEAVRPTHLLHLAWCTGHGLFWSDSSNLDWVAATLQLVRAFARSGGRRAVFAGTCAEYDWGHEHLDELRTPLAPRSLYGVAKTALHQTLMAAASGLGLSLAWARIFFLYGPREASGRLIPSVTVALLQGEPALCSEGSQQRDFMHVNDAAGALAAALRSDFEGAFNVASGNCVSLRSMVEIVGALTGRADLLRFGARPMCADEPQRLSASVDILRRRIGFEAGYDLRSGLAATVDWWRREIASA
jgi:nucleoside-diphosphate-sugar epimerase